jgi:hypothetical protein
MADVADRRAYAAGIAFGEKQEYTIQVAQTGEERQRAWALVYEAYAKKGYAGGDPEKLWYGLFDALPDTRTFLASRGGQDAATLTLVFDSPLGLPADALYGDELDAIRRRGRRACEIVSLVNVEDRASRCFEVLKHMFRLAYLTAVEMEDAQDFVITVNPHHAGYYEKKMLFERRGEERRYGKVGGAPAILLHLDLLTAPARYCATYGARSGSFYDFFTNRQSVRECLAYLRRNSRPLDEEDLDLWFERRRPVLSEAPPWVRSYVRGAYRRLRGFSLNDENACAVFDEGTSRVEPTGSCLAGRAAGE